MSAAQDGIVQAAQLGEGAFGLDFFGCVLHKADQPDGFAVGIVLEVAEAGNPAAEDGAVGDFEGTAGGDGGFVFCADFGQIFGADVALGFLR